VNGVSGLMSHSPYIAGGNGNPVKLEFGLTSGVG
jgi:hypothetical protein